MNETCTSAGFELVPAVRGGKADMKQEAVLDQLPGLRGGAHLVWSYGICGT
jgi:hypothetical protein